MNRIKWSTRGVGKLSGLEGTAVVEDRDVLPVTAALRALERLAGIEVTAFGSSCLNASRSSRTNQGTVCSSPGRRVYSVRFYRAGHEAAACLLVVEPLSDPDEPPTLERRASTSATA